MPAPKTVVYVVTKLELGGAQKVCLSLLKRVAQQGMRTILISGQEGVLVDQAREIGSEVYLLPHLQREVTLKTLWKEGTAFFSLCWQLYILRQQYGPLIVHTHSTKAGIMGRWAAWLTGVETIVHTVHGFGFHAYQKVWVWWLHYILEYWTSWITSEYVCVSARDRHQGAQLLPFFKQRCSLIRAAVEWRKFYTPSIRHSRTNQSDPVLIGTVSCLKRQKNLFDLLAAVKRLVSEDGHDVYLEIIGDGAQRGRIEQWIAHHQLAKHIKLRGWQEDVVPFVRSWQIFALSSLWEGLPCAVVEARLSHVPVVAYKVGGISEVIKHEKNGLLVSPGDREGLYRSVKRLVVDISLQQQLAGHTEQLNAFNDAVMATRHVKMYRNITGF